MKRLFLLLALVGMVVSSCSYDDTDIWDELNEQEQTLQDHEQRISALEELCEEMNTNISSLETLVEALDNGDSITNIAEVERDGKVVGYTITFASGDSITIYNGEDSEDGYVPTIGVAKGADGAYYWTVDGEWLTDDKGNKVKAEGSGTTPKLKIEDNYWYVSYDDGKSWQRLGEAVGEGGEGLFKSVTYDNEYVYFTLANGTVLALPRVVGVTPPADTPSGEINKIYYTTSDGKKMFPSDSGGAAFGAILISNSYVDGVGILIFDDVVTTIGEKAFYKCSSLTSVTIPDGVTTIGKDAFSGCSSLTSVTIGDGVTTIGDSAFENCDSLTSVTIPDGVTTIEKDAFEDCDSLTSVTIGDSVTTIGDYAFKDCSSLTSVTIPDSVTTIGNAAFFWCYSLTEFNGKFASEDGRCLIVDGVLNSFAPYGLTEYTIPDSVTTIGDDAFAGCSSLTSITILDSVTTIGDSAFSGCTGELIINSKIVETDYDDSNSPSTHGWLKGSNFSSLTINGVTMIGRYAFHGCSSLTSITIPDSVTEISSSAFSGCSSLTSITIPDSVTTIGDSAFSGCTGELIINNKIVETDYDSDNAPSTHGWLEGSNFSSLTIGNGVTLIGDSAFRFCDSLTSVTIPDSVTTIGWGAFWGCDTLTSVTIGDGVTTIEYYAFAYCHSLTSVTIGDGVTEIGYGAFESCDSLTSVTIPDSVTTIGDDAFEGCTSLTSVYCKATTPPSLGSEVFYYNHNALKIYVPTGSVNAYKSASKWSDYASVIVGYDF